MLKRSLTSVRSAMSSHPPASSSFGMVWFVGIFFLVFLGPVVLASNADSSYSCENGELRSEDGQCRTSLSTPTVKQTIDPDYPGTAVERMLSIRERAKSLTTEQLSGDWSEVRRHVLWAGGLRDLTSSRPGQGYTGHSFNDWNHCDLTAMNLEVSQNENKGQVRGIAFGNQLGPGIKIASLQGDGLGPGGSWSTCMMGCSSEPPADVAHLQFRARIAFKLVWCPPALEKFVLVDDAGALLNYGAPTGRLPALRERKANYAEVYGSKYAVEAERIGGEGGDKRPV